MPRLPIAASLALALSSPLAVIAGPAENSGEDLKTFVLENAHLRYELTPQLGGRGLAFSLPEHPNLLKVGAPVDSNPNPGISADGENIGYLGHIIWIGPQQDWWRFQSVNATRRKQEANWPPDPYTVLASNRVLQNTADKVVIQSEPSPVTGLQLTRSTTLDGEVLRHQVTATNTRDSTVNWDIWFNTRIPADSEVLVPVKDFSGDLRMLQLGDPSVHGSAQGDTHKQSRNFFGFARKEDTPLRAKAFIQPAAGWIAAFRGKQVFIIEFPLLDRTAIHPAHGQVELYIDYAASDDKNGLLELEVHGRYQSLRAGETMEAAEQWRVARYMGTDDLREKVEFLGLLGFKH